MMKAETDTIKLAAAIITMLEIVETKKLLLEKEAELEITKALKSMKKSDLAEEEFPVLEAAAEMLLDSTITAQDQRKKIEELLNNWRGIPSRKIAVLDDLIDNPLLPPEAKLEFAKDLGLENEYLNMVDQIEKGQSQRNNISDQNTIFELSRPEQARRSLYELIKEISEKEPAIFGNCLNKMIRLSP